MSSSKIWRHLNDRWENFQLWHSVSLPTNVKETAVISHQNVGLQALEASIWWVKSRVGRANYQNGVLLKLGSKKQDEWGIPSCLVSILQSLSPLCSSLPCLIIRLKYYFPKIILTMVSKVYVPATASTVFPIDVSGCDWHLFLSEKVFRDVFPITFSQLCIHQIMSTLQGSAQILLLKGLHNTPLENTVFIHYSIPTCTHDTHLYISLFHIYVWFFS